MRFMSWHLLLSAWLLVSAFALGHSEGSAALTGLVAVLVATFAFAAAGLPPVRFANTLMGVLLGCVALFSIESSALARLNNAVFGALIFVLSVVPGRAWGTIAQPEL